MIITKKTLFFLLFTTWFFASCGVKLYSEITECEDLETRFFDELENPSEVQQAALDTYLSLQGKWNATLYCRSSSLDSSEARSYQIELHIQNLSAASTELYLKPEKTSCLATGVAVYEVSIKGGDIDLNNTNFLMTAHLFEPTNSNHITNLLESQSEDFNSLLDDFLSFYLKIEIKTDNTMYGAKIATSTPQRGTSSDNIRYTQGEFCTITNWELLL